MLPYTLILVSLTLASSTEDRNSYSFTSYVGTVSAVGSDWLELDIGWTGPESTKAIWSKQNTKPKKLSGAGTKTGGNPEGRGERISYRIRDLKVHDRVSVWMSMPEKESEEWIAEIKLHRRPCGKIPPVPGEPFADLDGTHLRMQAEQDWEEKGVPIPTHFRDRFGRVLSVDPPFPPIAPQPRPR